MCQSYEDKKIKVQRIVKISPQGMCVCVRKFGEKKVNEKWNGRIKKSWRDSNERKIRENKIHIRRK